ncbi:MAG: prephenate dehydrogenase, partial [Candidatus Eremiobacteraeota bacterium]|nr:prephenate dehydrogenase [Candidatus Eremiobacteraeota bacterium]
MTIAEPLGIAGLGLIGGSIALRARRLGIRTMGWDTDASALRLVDVPASSLAALGGAAATLVLALPLEATLAAI